MLRIVKFTKYFLAIWLAIFSAFTTLSYAQNSNTKSGLETGTKTNAETPASAEQPISNPFDKSVNYYGTLLESAGSMLVDEPEEVEPEEDNLYGKIGDWRIYHVTNSKGWISCYGQLNDPTLPIRLISAGKVWGLAFTDDSDRQVSGKYIIDNKAKSFNAVPTGDGWAAIEINKRTFQKLKKALNLSLIPDNFGEISYHLGSFSVPLSIIETCVKNKGKIIDSDLLRPKALTFNPIGGGIAESGGFNIVGKGKSKEYRYAIARGWQVYSALYKNQFAYCVATRSYPGGNKVRLGYDNAQWQIAIPINNQKNWKGFLGVDGDFRFASGTAAGNWTIAWLGEPEIAKLKAGNQAILGYGRAEFEFPLVGSSAAISKIKECVERAGIAPEKKEKKKK